MSIYKIVRQQGPHKNRHGIKLSTVKPYLHKILFDYGLIDEYLKTDDQFVSVLFKIAEMELSCKRKNKLYHNPYNDEITTYDEVIEQSNLIKWNCAICNIEIESKIAEFDINNFVCNDCRDSHNSDNSKIDPRIVDSSFEFHKMCRKKLIKEQKKFLQYVKYFETGYTRGRI